MEIDIRCPHCNRCVGKINSTDPGNSTFNVFRIPIELKNSKERVIHLTCQRCKKEIYFIMDFRN